MTVSVATAAEKKPVYWQFTGPLGPEIRDAMALERSDDDAHHLILPDERDAYLSGIKLPDTLRCLDNSSKCKSVAHGVLEVLGFGARVLASGSKVGGVTQVKFVMSIIDGAKPETFIGQGPDIQTATKKAYAALHGQGTLALKLSPMDASFRINNEPYGQGSGDYIIPAGKHQLLVEAPERRSMEQPIVIEPSKTLQVIVDLPIAAGKLSLSTEPENASVFLDGTRWKDPKTAREVEAGPHTIRVEAKGYVTFTRDVTIKPAVAHDLNLKLQPKDPPWRIALRTAHADTQANHFLVRGGLQLGSTRGGEIDEGTNLGRMDSLDESGALIGFDVSLDWRYTFWTVTALGISMQSGGAKAKTSLEGTSTSELENVSRTLIRVGWGGVRQAMGRFELFATMGMGAAFETFSGKTITQKYEATVARFIIGNEFGLRYAFTEDWFAGSSAVFDYLPGSRTTAVFLINGGYAFNLPDGWL